MGRWQDDWRLTLLSCTLGTAWYMKKQLICFLWDCSEICTNSGLTFALSCSGAHELIYMKYERLRNHAVPTVQYCSVWDWPFLVASACTFCNKHPHFSWRTNCLFGMGIALLILGYLRDWHFSLFFPRRSWFNQRKHRWAITSIVRWKNALSFQLQTVARLLFSSCIAKLGNKCILEHF
jgi:hypothetical protein